jgi:arylsulfatase A-like enzyme
LAQIAGLPTPSNIDGISILPGLLGHKQKQHEYLYWDYGHVRETFKQALRLGCWKAVRIGVNQPLELYHLKDDPGETTDVAAKHPEIVKKIKSLMVRAYAYSPDYPIKGFKQGL